MCSRHDCNALYIMTRRLSAVRNVIQQLEQVQQCRTKYCDDYLHCLFQVFFAVTVGVGFLTGHYSDVTPPFSLRKLSSSFTVEPGTEYNSYITYLTKNISCLSHVNVM